MSPEEIAVLLAEAREQSDANADPGLRRRCVPRTDSERAAAEAAELALWAFAVLVGGATCWLLARWWWGLATGTGFLPG